MTSHPNRIKEKYLSIVNHIYESKTRHLISSIRKDQNWPDNCFIPCEKWNESFYSLILSSWIFSKNILRLFDDDYLTQQVSINHDKILSSIKNSKNWSFMYDFKRVSLFSNIDACFTYINSSNEESLELIVVLCFTDGTHTINIIDLNKNIEAELSKSDNYQALKWILYLSQCVSCKQIKTRSSNSIIELPKAKKTKSGWVLFPANKVRTWSLDLASENQ